MYFHVACSHHPQALRPGLQHLPLPTNVRLSVQIGAHALVFTGSFDKAGLTHAISETKNAGFDLIEIPLMDPAGFDRGLAAQLVKEYDLASTASLGLGESTDLSSADPAVAAAGEKMLTECLEIVHTMGGKHP